MPGQRHWKSILVGSTCLVLSSAAFAGEFSIAGGDLKDALNAYSVQSGLPLLVSTDAVKGIRSSGIRGDFSNDAALNHLLSGTGFVAEHRAGGTIAVVRGHDQSSDAGNGLSDFQLAQAAPSPRTAVETVTVTSSKLGGADVQSIPIAITALSQEQLTATQTAGGPDLVKQVPNLTFTKTNFTGYSIQIRGIGTQAISVTTDPAVAVAMNDIPFIRNHFFEQEFFDVSQVEVLRGPQGTLYGRNATAGVVNVITAKPTDQFEAMASADIGNYKNRRFEGMINLPLVDDRLDLRVAGEWTKRDGYSFNEITNQPIDGRDLWSGRASLRWRPNSKIDANLVWEHFQENDDRMRTAKQLCKTAPIPTNIDGVNPFDFGGAGGYSDAPDYLSQGCQMTSLYSKDAFEVPNGYTLTYYSAAQSAGAPVQNQFNIYSTTTQSTNLRDIAAQINPIYRAKNDTIELNVDYDVIPALTFNSASGYNQDYLWSTEDYNRFNSQQGAFVYVPGLTLPDPAAGTNGIPANAGIFCDPQLGCSDRLVLQDLSDEHAWQFSQEFRLASHFTGPLNFSVGGNYMHYETEENYYVFINTITALEAANGSGIPRTSNGILPYTGGGDITNSFCLLGGYKSVNPAIPQGVLACGYIDPNPLTSLNNEGHNYFLNQNPYTLNSFAGFGEAYYNITQDLKLTGGLRWTVDRKYFVEIPSEIAVPGYGYATTGVVNQKWSEWTGRAAANWTPKLEFTDQTFVYASYAHGYKAGGANPPGANFAVVDQADLNSGIVTDPIHPLTFKPEFIDAFELGFKNTALDGALTLNGDVFYYIYKGYQISRIVDRTAINDNFNAHVRGAELETTWQPAPGLKFAFAGGYEDATLDKGDHSVDLMDRAAGNSNWIVVRPYVTTASNCILPTYVVAADLQQTGKSFGNGAFFNACNEAYSTHVDPVTGFAYTPNPMATVIGLPPPSGYPGFDPTTAPNNGEGFDKNLSGNQLPNAPHFTVSFSAEYTVPLTADWAGTLRGDYYWQDYSWARVFNDNPYDRLRGYTSVNLALILTSQSGWQVMGYVKNVFDTTAITGAFLNSDDSGLTTNVFLTDPRLYGVRVTKNF